jgi:hypothetical protein
MKVLKLTATIALSVLCSSAAFAAAVCPNFGVATGCTTIITVDSSGTLTAGAGPSPQPTYDGSEDQVVGFYNNSLVSISSIHLSGGTGNPIFEFDGDGIDVFPYNAPSNSSDNSGYGGPDSFFTGISADLTSGTVNFVTPIAAGGFTYFSLEEPFDANAPITGGVGGATPEPSTLVLLGTGAIGLATTVRRKLKA